LDIPAQFMKTYIIAAFLFAVAFIVLGVAVTYTLNPAPPKKPGQPGAAPVAGGTMSNGGAAASTTGGTMPRGATLSDTGPGGNTNSSTSTSLSPASRHSVRPAQTGINATEMEQGQGEGGASPPYGTSITTSSRQNPQGGTVGMTSPGFPPNFPGLPAAPGTPIGPGTPAAPGSLPPAPTSTSASNSASTSQSSISVPVIQPTDLGTPSSPTAGQQHQ
jgi:hypothetical protein